MTDEEKLEMNMAVARVLDKGEDVFAYDSVKAAYYHDGTHTEVDIFGCPPDCLEVVKKLGEIYHASIGYTGIQTAYSEKWYVEMGGYYEAWRETYEEVVGAACVKVMEYHYSMMQT